MDMQCSNCNVVAFDWPVPDPSELPVLCPSCGQRQFRPRLHLVSEESSSEFDHVEAARIDGVIYDAISRDPSEREALLAECRNWVLHSIATLIDDTPGFSRAEHDELLIALSDGALPPGYPDTEMARAGLGVIRSYDSRDFPVMRDHLRILDRLSIEQLSIVNLKVFGRPNAVRLGICRAGTLPYF